MSFPSVITSVMWLHFLVPGWSPGVQTILNVILIKITPVSGDGQENKQQSQVVTPTEIALKFCLQSQQHKSPVE